MGFDFRFGKAVVDMDQDRGVLRAAVEMCPEETPKELVGEYNTESAATYPQYGEWCDAMKQTQSCTMKRIWSHVEKLMKQYDRVCIPLSYWRHDVEALREETVGDPDYIRVRILFWAYWIERCIELYGDDAALEAS